jgi:hypothetical protein
MHILPTNLPWDTPSDPVFPSPAIPSPEIMSVLEECIHVLPMSPVSNTPSDQFYLMTCHPPYPQIMNMKPPEILSLLEEASGTKLYERKKDSAMKTLAKKQTRLEEIDEVCRQCGTHMCATL